MSDKTDRVTGKVQEAAGKATGDAATARKGRDKQAKGNLKAGAEKLKDSVKKSV